MVFVYSGVVPALDDLLRLRLGKRGLFTAIPYAAGEAGAADEAAQYFRDVVIPVSILAACDYTHADRVRRAILASDAVYLMGGNTYEFLDYARAIDLFAVLTEFESRGGLIVAESAGSIILSPDIATAGIPSSFPDDNTLDLQQFDAMGRLPFHISPHFEPEVHWAQRDLQELQALADLSAYPVVVLEDGEGLVVEGSRISRFIGNEKILTPGGKPLLPAFYAAGKGMPADMRQPA